MMRILAHAAVMKGNVFMIDTRVYGHLWKYTRR